MPRTASLCPAGMVTTAATFSLGIRVPVGISARAMTTSSSGWRRMVSSAACSIACSSVIVARHERAALADEEVEIRALVRLQDVVVIEAPVAALERWLRRLPPGLALLQFGIRHEKLQPSLRYIQLDLVAVLDQRERAARGRLGRHVQHYRAVRRAAHARVRNAHHVGDAFLQELRRQ